MATESVASSGDGQGGIRTHETREGPPVFKTGAFNRSATCPGGVGLDADVMKGRMEGGIAGVREWGNGGMGE